MVERERDGGRTERRVGGLRRARTAHASLTRRTAVLLAALLVACGSAPGPQASPATAAVTTEGTADSAAATGESEETFATDATVDATEAVTTTTNGSSTAATSDGSAPSTATGKATTTTAKSGGGATSTTVRATTTTIKPKPTTTVTQPPVTPAPTPPPTVPPTPAPTSPPRTIGSCQQLSLDTVNGWRATLGRPALTFSSSLYNGACNWATHLAETDTHTHAPGVSGEVIAGSSGSCSAALSIWLGSSGHYAVLTSALVSTGGIACVKDSEGSFWAVGRVGS